MECKRVRVFLNGYVDGELDLVTSIDIEEHLQGCAACSSQRAALERLHAATSNRALYHPAPEGLEKRIRYAIKKANSEQRGNAFGWWGLRPSAIHGHAFDWWGLRPAANRGSIFSWRGLGQSEQRKPAFDRQGSRAAAARPAFGWQWFGQAVALVAVLVLLVALFGRGLFAPAPNTRLALADVKQEVQDAHVRSMQANHLMDVASSDQHTVKPWFDGKLDFSPAVPDLAAQGFPLTGGRLDYINGHAVAALVYMRNKHIINLFTWPSQEKQAGLQNSTENGYNIFYWTQTGNTYWVISDLNADELRVFIRAYQDSKEYPK